MSSSDFILRFNLVLTNYLIFLLLDSLAVAIYTVEIPREAEENFGILHSLSSYGMWAAKEEDIARTLNERLQDLETQRQLIRSYLSGYKKGRRKLVSTAIQGHQMARRHTSEISALHSFIPEDYLDNLKLLGETLELQNAKLNQGRSYNWVNTDVSTNREESEKEQKIWVGWQDLYMSMVTFFHNMDIYGFEPEDMQEGVDLESNYGGKMHVTHSAELGMFALFKIKYYAAIEWLELAAVKLAEFQNMPKSMKSVDSSLINQLLSLSVQEHNHAFNNFLNDDSPLKTGDHERFFNFYLEPLIANLSSEDRIRYRHDLFWNSKGLENHSQLEAQFIDLCMGNVAQTPEMQRNLKCYYEQTQHPYLYINPVKVEHLSEAPPVFQFYEMLGNRTIELIKNMQSPLVTLSQLVGTTGVDLVTVFRTSAGVGMATETTPALVYDLAEYVTGLKIRGASEHLQFVEYTYGRYYDYHIDAFEYEDVLEVAQWGDRVATVLYYLEMPELGGLTPFCQAGVSAHPVRGSAVVWYNMYRNGTQDTNHGACPVIHGHKIIMNHWIRYNGNWNTFKCSLNQFE